MSMRNIVLKILIVLAVSGYIPAAAHAQDSTVAGLVTGRNGEVLYVRMPSSTEVKVVISEDTVAQQKSGVFGWTRKDLAITEIVPGLAVKVVGAYDDDHEFLAKKISFSRASFQESQAIDAGLNPVANQVAQAQTQLSVDRNDIANSQKDIAQNTTRIDANSAGLAATSQTATRTAADLSATQQRLTELDSYTTENTLTITFANGSSSMNEKDKHALSDFVRNIANTPGYMIEVQGYASAVGDAQRNQQLSSARAEAVIASIQQTGAVPITRILAPAAMGTTGQIANNETRKGQAENRRVVVNLLVNKGIAG